MKTLIMVESGRTQLVLQPENEHDRAVLKLLEKLPHTHRDEFFHCQGGWTRHKHATLTMYDRDTDDRRCDLVIVFDDPQKEPPAEVTP